MSMQGESLVNLQKSLDNMEEKNAKRKQNVNLSPLQNVKKLKRVQSKDIYNSANKLPPMVHVFGKKSMGIQSTINGMRC